MREWLFRLLFRAEYEHLRELIDDVARLEKPRAENWLWSGATGATTKHDIDIVR